MTVPSRIPTSSPKIAKESATPMATRAESKKVFIRANGLPVTLASATTVPSPGV